MENNREMRDVLTLDEFIDFSQHPGEAATKAAGGAGMPTTRKTATKISKSSI